MSLTNHIYLFEPLDKIPGKVSVSMLALAALPFFIFKNTFTPESWPVLMIALYCRRPSSPQWSNSWLTALLKSVLIVVFEEESSHSRDYIWLNLSQIKISLLSLLVCNSTTEKGRVVSSKLPNSKSVQLSFWFG